MKLKSFALLALLSSWLWGDILVYGPGGPAPVLKKLALLYNQTSQEKVIIHAGPTSSWINKAKKNADIIYSGNSSMMDSFLDLMGNKLNPSDIQVLNIREAGVIVRPTNPKKITRFSDLLKDGVKIMIVNGAGQVGLYEDMALKYGKRSNLVDLRKNIQVIAKNSKQAIELWEKDPSIDALIIWRHWATVLGKDKARFIRIDKNNNIYRASEIAITTHSRKKEEAQKFIDFLQTKEAQNIWREEGWISNY
ncbi:extracellular solute-binding protein [Helicobacter pametensis]|uniref:extracellular solute-binding protein n=1 Tax=Helicobacter pametensis TaxID=95149 RepID=UPI0004887854|nr:extracellular solute-binding protein [Helicobacter pametensis]